MTDAEKRLSEFYKEFTHVRETDRHYHNPWIPEMKSFLVESIHQAIAEERERVRGIVNALDVGRPRSTKEELPYELKKEWLDETKVVLLSALDKPDKE